MKNAFTKIYIVVLLTLFTCTSVQALSGLTKHVFKIHHQVGSNANLTYLHLSHGDLSPAFVQTTLAYTASVPNSVRFITLREYTGDAAATVKVNGVTVPFGAITGSIPLNAGANTINIVVTAQDGVTTQTYTVTVTRAPSSNANLGYFVISHGVMSPVFAQTTTSYTASVLNEIDTLTIKFGTADSTAAATVNGAPLASNVVSAPIPLIVGPNPISVAVKAQDGITIQTYTVIVTRAPSANANLTYLGISRVTLSPVFTQATTNYTSTVPNKLDTINLKFGTADPTATATVNGVALASGVVSAPIALAVGKNNIDVAVKAQNGTIKTYAIVITRLSSNADLAYLELSAGTLTHPDFHTGTYVPGFLPEDFFYVVNEPNDISAITVKFGVADTTSIGVTVNGTPVASGVVSPSLPLIVGSNSVSILVTAQDGTTKNYYLAVYRAAFPPNLQYFSSRTFVVDTAITTFTPTNIGGPLDTPPGFSPTLTMTSQVFGFPFGITTSMDNYIVFGGKNDTWGGFVAITIPGGGDSPVPVATGFITPYGLATDTQGNVYVADTGKSFITKIPATGAGYNGVNKGFSTSLVSLGSGFNAPTGVCVDAAGFIYVADNGNGLLKKMSPDGTTITSIGTGLVKPAGVVLDNAGNIYVADNGDNTVKKIAAGTNTTTVLASGFSNVTGITLNGAGNIFVTDRGNNSVVEVFATGDTTVIATGVSGLGPGIFAGPYPIGALYIGAPGRIDLIKPSGGCYIYPALPAGLNFDTLTGAISGTPAQVSPLTDYTVGAYNSSGIGISYFSLAVAAPPVAMAARQTNDAISVHQGLSPNGDGLNDVLKIDGLNAFPDNKLTIMSKDGAVVFEAKNYGDNIKAFDGHSNNGALQKPGDYFYLLEYKAGAQIKRKTGYIVLKY